MLRNANKARRSLFFLKRTVSPRTSLLNIHKGIARSKVGHCFHHLTRNMFSRGSLRCHAGRLVTFLSSTSTRCKFSQGGVMTVKCSGNTGVTKDVVCSFGSTIGKTVLRRPVIPFHGHRLPSLRSLPIFVNTNAGSPLYTPRRDVRLGTALRKTNDRMTVC